MALWGLQTAENRLANGRLRVHPWNRLFKDVLLGDVGMDDAIAALTSLGMRAYAFETPVGACDADG